MSEYGKNNSYTVPYNQRGWWYECSCGHKKNSNDVSSTHTGTEAGAIKTWKAHSSLYAQLTGETVSNELTQTVKAEREYIAKYKELCYCKGANDDLILLEQSRPKSLDV